eukprot:gene1346-1700_t
MNTTTTDKNGINTNNTISKIEANLKTNIETALTNHSTLSAIFFADKLLSLSPLNSQTARCKLETNEWDSCLEILGGDTTDSVSGNCFGLIFSQNFDNSNNNNNDSDSNCNYNNILANCCMIRGRCFEAMENLKKARYWYIQSLFLDYHCYESFDSLVKNHLLNYSEELELLNTLKFSPDDQWLRDLYSITLKKYDNNNSKNNNNNKSLNTSGLLLLTPPKSSLSTSLLSALSSSNNNNNNTNNNNREQILTISKSLITSNDVQTSLAEYHFYHHNYQESYRITKKILKEDKFYNNQVCLMVHLSSMYELQLKNELYYTCHQLIESSPHSAISWYGVACYYHLIQNHDLTQKFFTKSTSLDSKLGAGWIGYGHFFANKGEHDQAMAAYRTAARLLTGCHLPLLCIGMELIRVHNLNLASQYIHQAKDICPYDPLIYNELGIIEYKNQNYQGAIKYFEKALHISTTSNYNNPNTNNNNNFSSTTKLLSLLIKNNNTTTTTTNTNTSKTTLPIYSESWEPTIFNLAHCYRVLRQFDKAMEYYEISLSLSPNNASVYTAIGFTHHLQGHFEEAIDFYHQSLSIRDDPFTNTLLHKALSLSFLKYD